MAYDERVRTSYWNTTFPNATVRENQIQRFLERCDEECIPMDRVTAVALSDKEMTDLAKRFFATTAEGTRIKTLVHGMTSQRLSHLMEDLKKALPNHHVSLRETLRHGLCIEVDGRRYTLDSISRSMVCKL